MPHHSNLGLPQPFPQALGKYPSKFGFYCYRESNRFCFHNFHSAYAAKHFLELMIDGRDVKWLKTDTILIDGDVKIRGEQGSLETIMEYELKPKEREWEIPEPHISHYRQFLGKQKSLEQPDNPTPQQVMRSPVNTSSVDPVKRQKAKLKVQAGDHITIGQIAQELGKDPRDCRAALRALKVAKPDHGQWSWPKGEAENIKKKLKGKVK